MIMIRGAVAKVNNDEERKKIMMLRKAAGVRAVFDVPDELSGDNIENLMRKVIRINDYADGLDIGTIVPASCLSSTIVLWFQPEMDELEFQGWLENWSGLVGSIELKGLWVWRDGYGEIFDNKLRQELRDFLQSKVEAVVHGGQ